MFTNILYLGIIILVLVLFGNYIHQRLEDQNHKIVTLASIVTTLTGEIQQLKSQPQIQVQEQTKPAILESVEIKQEKFDNNALICVSDDEIDEVEDDEEDDDDEEDEDDEEDDNDDLRLIDSDIVTCQDLNQDEDCIKIINMMNSLLGGGVGGGVCSETQIFFTTTSTPEEPTVVEENRVEQLDEVNTEIICAGKESEYSKLTVDQLRKIVAEKQLSNKPSKLKKTELLQLLEGTKN